MSEIIIKDGTVVDGSGNPWFRADITIEDGKIAGVGRLGSDAERVIDARGLMVCPGFIDLHTHSDIIILVNPRAESFIRQGITTQIVGNCGYSAAPIRKETAELNTLIFRYPEVDVNWETLGGYFSRLEEQGTSINTGSWVGHNTVRISVMGCEMRAPTREEMEEMKGLVAQALEDGAFGLSSGLIYTPGNFAEISELIELCKVSAMYGGIYNTHLRSMLDDFIEATKEAIEIAEKAGLPLQIAHHSPTAPPNWGKTEESLRLILEARERGIDVTNDLHGYLWGSSSLKHGLPPWVLEGGSEKTSEKLRDPRNRERIMREMKGEIPTPEWKTRTCATYLPSVGSWDQIIIIESKAEWTGNSIKEIAESARQNPWDSYFEILAEDPDVLILQRLYSEGDRQRNFNSPFSMVSADASSIAASELFIKARFHPKNYGTFPMILRKYVREKQVLTWEGAIRKMTSMPAQKLKLWNRGLIRPGMWADIVVFDPKTIADRATYEDPHQYPKGIYYVLVNGVVTVEEGEHTGALAGNVLRHKTN